MIGGNRPISGRKDWKGLTSSKATDLTEREDTQTHTRTLILAQKFRNLGIEAR